MLGWFFLASLTGYLLMSALIQRIKELDMHKVCDGCGALMDKPPLVMHNVTRDDADVTVIYNFDTFECYERARASLGLLRDKVVA